MSGSELRSVAAELADGRDLGGFDREAIEAVAGLVLRLRESRRVLADEGALTIDPYGNPTEHPAADVERRTSAEIRGWVKQRPDLFGAKSEQVSEDKPGALSRFKVV